MCTHLDVFWNKKTHDTANGLPLESSHVGGWWGAGSVCEIKLPRSKT